jgi:hypothetical protein
MKMKKIKIIVQTFSDPSVGIFGGSVPFTIELPEESWSHFDDDEKISIVKSMKQLALNVIDPDGTVMTAQEIEAESDMWNKIYEEEMRLQENDYEEER